MPRNLSVVKPGAAKPAKAPARSPRTVKAAAEHSERALLVALRTRIATDIDQGVPAAYLAPLSRQLRDIDREIRALDARAAEEASESSGAAPDEEFDASAV